MTQPRNPVIEAILQDQFPSKVLLDFSNAFALSGPGGLQNVHITQPRAAIDAARIELATLSPARLKVLHDAVVARNTASTDAAAVRKRAGQQAKVAAKEAARFFNQPGADADFAHWCNADYWTLDEAVALLLSKEPGVVNPQAFKRESSADLVLFFNKNDKAAEPVGFARTYSRLRALMERAETLVGSRLKPVAVVEWARKTKAVVVPEPLACMASKPGPLLSNADVLAVVDLSPTRPGAEVGAPPALRVDYSAKKWTPELLAALSAHCKRAGTKAAADHYGISGARVRELLRPAKAAKAGRPANSVFDLGRKR